MDCQQLLTALNEYIDGDIDPAVCEKFEEHLADCRPCQVVVDTIRKTITLYKGDDAVHEVPLEFRDRLHTALRKKWAMTFECDQGDDDADSKMDAD